MSKKVTYDSRKLSRANRQQPKAANSANIKKIDMADYDFEHKNGYLVRKPKK